MAAPPRVTAADIAAFGGTIPALTNALVDILSDFRSPMEEKEKAAGMLHALADQQIEGRDIGARPRALDQMLLVKGLVARGAGARMRRLEHCHAPSSILQRRLPKGAPSPLPAHIPKWGTGAAQEHAAAAIASLSSCRCGPQHAEGALVRLSIETGIAC